MQHPAFHVVALTTRGAGHTSAADQAAAAVADLAAGPGAGRDGKRQRGTEVASAEAELDGQPMVPPGGSLGLEAPSKSTRRTQGQPAGNEGNPRIHRDSQSGGARRALAGQYAACGAIFASPRPSSLLSRALANLASAS